MTLYRVTGPLQFNEDESVYDEYADGFVSPEMENALVKVVFGPDEYNDVLARIVEGPMKGLEQWIAFESLTEVEA